MGPRARRREVSAILNDGGPAFPQFGATTSDGAIYYGSERGPEFAGMSLRDYLAARCPLAPAEFAELYGMPLPDILRSEEHSKTFWMLYTTERYNYADAMIAARKGGAT
jgi:hypothetical protein